MMQPSVTETSDPTPTTQETPAERLARLQARKAVSEYNAAHGIPMPRRYTPAFWAALYEIVEQWPVTSGQ